MREPRPDVYKRQAHAYADGVGLAVARIEQQTLDAAGGLNGHVPVSYTHLLPVV